MSRRVSQGIAEGIAGYESHQFERLAGQTGQGRVGQGRAGEGSNHTVACQWSSCTLNAAVENKTQ